MNLLSIDTSTDIAFVALHVQGRYYELEKAGMRSHAHALLPMIEQVLCEAKIKLNQLDGIVFGQGPGSFTGLRVACSMAKGLSYGLELPLYPVCTLSAVVWGARQSRNCTEDASILALMDARMDQLYWLFDAGNTSSAVQVSDPERIDIQHEAPLVIAGTSWHHYENRLPSILRTHVVATCDIDPKASWMIQMVLRGMIDPVHAKEAQPLYVRNEVTGLKK